MGKIFDDPLPEMFHCCWIHLFTSFDLAISIYNNPYNVNTHISYIYIYHIYNYIYYTWYTAAELDWPNGMVQKWWQSQKIVRHLVMAQEAPLDGAQGQGLTCKAFCSGLQAGSWGHGPADLALGPVGPNKVPGILGFANPQRPQHVRRKPL